MAKVELIGPKPTLPAVRLELSGQEAEVLHAILGCSSGPVNGYDIYAVLHDALKGYPLRDARGGGCVEWAP